MSVQMTDKALPDGYQILTTNPEISDKMRAVLLAATYFARKNKRCPAYIRKTMEAYWNE